MAVFGTGNTLIAIIIATAGVFAETEFTDPGPNAVIISTTDIVLSAEATRDIADLLSGAATGLTGLSTQTITASTPFIAVFSNDAG